MTVVEDDDPDQLSSKRPEPSMKTIAATALALKYSVLAYATPSFFLSVAYQSFLPTLAGMVAALEYSVARQLAASASSTVPAHQPKTAAALMTVPALPVVGLKSKFQGKHLAQLGPHDQGIRCVRHAQHDLRR
jgi:hypothetical protein